MAEEIKKIDGEEENTGSETETGKESTGGSEDSAKNGGSENKGSESKTFTQEQVNRMMTREKNQGRNAVYKELGIDPKDSKTVNMFKAFMESQKTEEQKAAEKQAEEQNKVTEAEQRAMVAEAKAEAMMMGVKTQFVDDVVTLALSKMTEGSDLKTIIGEFKTKYAVWFGGSSDDDSKEDDKKGKTGQKGTGSSVKSSGKDKPGEENKGLGARLAAQRKTSGKKSSYWGNK